MFKHKVVHKCSWYKTTINQQSVINFVVIPSGLQLYVLDTWVKGRADRSGRPKSVVRVSWECLTEAALTHTTGRASSSSKGRLQTWNPSGICSHSPLKRQLQVVVVRRLSVPAMAT